MKTKHVELETLLEQAQQPRIPSAETLAHLAAQARFTSLPPNAAIVEAVKLWDEADNLVRARERLELVFKWISEHKPALPANFPATLEGDFYKLIVRGKYQSNNQPRYREFCKDKIRKLFAHSARTHTDENVENAAQAEFLRRKNDGFPDETAWLIEAGKYDRWWKEKISNDRARAGRARAAQGYTKRIAGKNNTAAAPSLKPRAQKSV